VARRTLPFGLSVFLAGGWDQLFRWQMLTEEPGCATSFLPAPAKDMGGLWAWERDGGRFWQWHFWDEVFISASSNPLLKFPVGVCFWQCGCIWLFYFLLPPPLQLLLHGSVISLLTQATVMRKFETGVSASRNNSCHLCALAVVSKLLSPLEQCACTLV